MITQNPRSATRISPKRLINSPGFRPRVRPKRHMFNFQSELGMEDTFKFGVLSLENPPPNKRRGLYLVSPAKNEENNTKLGFSPPNRRGGISLRASRKKKKKNNAEHGPSSGRFAATPDSDFAGSAGFAPGAGSPPPGSAPGDGRRPPARLARAQALALRCARARVARCAHGDREGGRKKILRNASRGGERGPICSCSVVKLIPFSKKTRGGTEKKTDIVSSKWKLVCKCVQNHYPKAL